LKNIHPLLQNHCKI